MQTYHINELERLTGIKAHTIRIWEKRYKLVVPDRTDTNRRHYDESQVRKLLNVTTLLSKGLKISKIAALNENEFDTQLQSQTSNNTPENIAVNYINDLIKSMIAFDENAFEKTYAAATLRFGFYESMLQIVYPFLHKTGILWSVNKTAPVQEHFATNIISRKLHAAIDGLPPATIRDKKFILFLPPGEWHEIGLLLANYIIRAKGYETIYLGQNVPYDNVNEVAAILSPQYILLFYIAPRQKYDIQQQIDALAQKNEHTKILIAGNMNLFNDNKSNSKNIAYLTKVSSLADHL